MITRKDVITISMTTEEYELAKELAGETWNGQKSNIIVNRDERLLTGLQHQIQGQLGELALHKLYYGTDAIEKFKFFRRLKNKTPYKSDDGYDLIDQRVDIKCSLLRNTRIDPFEYFLWVRKKEYHADGKYIFAMVYFDVLPKVFVFGQTTGINLKPENFEGDTRYFMVVKDLDKFSI